MRFATARNFILLVFGILVLLFALERLTEQKIFNSVLQSEPVKSETPLLLEKKKDGLVASQSEKPFEEKVTENLTDLTPHIFNPKESPLSFVETISYKAKVPWQKGRSAWLSDYARHFKTPLAFIELSLASQGISLDAGMKEGQPFNVFRSDKRVSFYLIVDVSSCKLWLYYIEGSQKKAELIKTYLVTLGRKSEETDSKLLTPLGTYELGDKTATYKPKVMGQYKGNRTEMIKVFGTRWIPFSKEVANCTAPAKGFGIHGAPWIEDPKTGKLKEDLSNLGEYESDGCIRLASKDVEELFAIISNKPARVEIVSDMSQAKRLYGDQ